MCLAYAAIGGAWLWLCWTHRDDLQPIQVRGVVFISLLLIECCSLQYYLSSLFGLLVIEMLANWGQSRLQ
jgi:hypothetical protein